MKLGMGIWFGWVSKNWFRKYELIGFLFESNRIKNDWFIVKIKKKMINIFLLVLLHKTWIINNYNWIGLKKIISENYKILVNIKEKILNFINWII